MMVHGGLVRRGLSRHLFTQLCVFDRGATWPRFKYKPHCQNSMARCMVCGRAELAPLGLGSAAGSLGAWGCLLLFSFPNHRECILSCPTPDTVSPRNQRWGLLVCTPADSTV